MYNSDLAFIHDTGFADYALKSAPAILNTLRGSAKPGSLVVDLGCGSCLLSREMLKASYRVLGIDISEPMIKIARRKAPAAMFLVASAFDVQLPECAAIVSVSECLNYMSEGRSHRRGLVGLFKKAYRSLAPGGAFIFDMAVPGQVPAGETVTVFTEGEDWLVLAEKHEDPESSVLTRRIITFRRAGSKYRRAEEVHRQALYPSTAIAEQLRRIGFKVRVSRSYGAFQLPKARAAFFCRKPA
jgi:SAM-dependent methyltransferase